MSKFEVYKDKKGETRFRYRAANGEIVFSSEGYKAKASATKAIDTIKKSVAGAPVEEIPPATARKPAIVEEIASTGRAARETEARRDGRRFLVTAFWDGEARVWVATSDDIPGLVTEAKTLDALVERVTAVLPELLEDNAAHLLPGYRPSDPVDLHFSAAVRLEAANAH